MIGGGRPRPGLQPPVGQPAAASRQPSTIHAGYPPHSCAARLLQQSSPIPNPPFGAYTHPSSHCPSVAAHRLPCIRSGPAAQHAAATRCLQAASDTPTRAGAPGPAACAERAGSIIKTRGGPPPDRGGHRQTSNVCGVQVQSVLPLLQEAGPTPAAGPSPACHSASAACPRAAVSHHHMSPPWPDPN